MKIPSVDPTRAHVGAVSLQQAGRWRCPPLKRREVAADRSRLPRRQWLGEDGRDRHRNAKPDPVQRLGTPAAGNPEEIQQAERSVSRPRRSKTHCRSCTWLQCHRGRANLVPRRYRDDRPLRPHRGDVRWSRQPRRHGVPVLLRLRGVLQPRTAAQWRPPLPGMGRRAAARAIRRGGTFSLH